MKRNKNIYKISIFNFLVILLLAAVTIVFLVNNIINIHKLLADNNSLKDEIKRTTDANNNLLMEIERISAYDKIKDVATNKLNLNYSNHKFKKLTIPKSQLELLD